MDETKGGASSQHPELFRNDPHRPAPKIDVDNPLEKMRARLTQGGGKQSPPPGGGEGGGEDGDGMVRMSFLEHLGELRARIMRALAGFGVVFLVCMAFSSQLWKIVQAPVAEALGRTGIQGVSSRRDQSDGEVLHHLDVDASGGRDFSRVALDYLSGLGIHFAGPL